MDVSVIEHESTLTVVNARPEFERAAIWLGDFAAGAGLPDDLCSRLLVALDEVLSNVVNHGLAGAMEGEREIRLCVRIRAQTVELDIVDDGPVFDPTTVVSATLKADQRAGGAGLLFVRALMDEVRFSRQGDRNCLTLCKRLAAPA
jgi:anti-sigma regulatory factor (Ser/Thr protein kinase)